MRRFFVSAFAAAVTLCASVTPSVAQTNPQSATNAPVEASAEQQYRDAVALLRNGRKFETAIAKLRSATRQNPTNAPYHSALGCALVSRAVSIAEAARQAAEYPGNVSDYNDAMALWEAAQKQPGAILYGQPRPVPPFLPTMKDDGKTFKMSKERAEQSYDELGKEAVQELEVGLQAARTDDQKAQVYLLTGWTKSLLRVGRFEMKLSAALQQATAQPKCVEAVRTAVKLLPNEPSVWRNVGDVVLLDRYAGKSENDFKYDEEATRAYERSVVLNKKALDLWYVLFLMESRHDAARAEVALNQALRLDSGNAFLWYEKAYFIPHRVSGSLAADTATEADAAKMNVAQWLRVLDAIEQGNSVGRFRFVGTRPQPPLLLAAAWQVCAKSESLPLYRFVTTNIYLSGVLSESIGAARKQKDAALSKRWSQAAVGMGQILSRDVLSGAVSPVSPPASSAVGLVAMEGKFALQQGYDGLIALQEPGSETVRALRQEKQRVTEIIDGWSKAHIDAHKSQFRRAYEQ